MQSEQNGTGSRAITCMMIRFCGLQAIYTLLPQAPGKLVASRETSRTTVVLLMSTRPELQTLHPEPYNETTLTLQPQIPETHNAYPDI